MALTLALDNQIGDLFDTAEILNLEVLHINLGVEILLDLEKQFDQPLRIQDAGVEQVGLNRRDLHLHRRKYRGQSRDYVLCIPVHHMDF